MGEAQADATYKGAPPAACHFVGAMAGTHLIWIEIDLYNFQLFLPANVGRLPTMVGEPAGGSLTADQWMILATVIGPLVVSSDRTI